MRACCDFVHAPVDVACPAARHSPLAEVFEGRGTVLSEVVPTDRVTGGAVEALLVWVVGVLAAGALVAMFIANVPVSELLQLLALS